MRKIIPLKDNWFFYKDEPESLTAIAENGEKISLPHTWNNIDGQDGGDDYYRGKCWYIKELPQTEIKDGEQVYLEITGAAMTAEVFVNGKQTVHHEGGYSTFRTNIIKLLNNNGENIIAVSADNSRNDTVYPQYADFTFYGGLYREVNLITVPKEHFELDYRGTPGIRITPVISEDMKSADVEITVWTANADGKNVQISVEGTGEKTAVIKDGKADVIIHIENVHLWNGRIDPYLYTAKATLDNGADMIKTRFGCRKFGMDAEKGFILNGKEYPLRGVSRHQDRKGAGNALTYDMHKQDIDIIAEMGANTIRLAHYQHAQEFYDLCDEYGMVCWAEIPYITRHMKNGRANTLSQMEELVVQNYNHPCVVCWGLSNEITVSPVEDTEDLLENHRQLNALCHRLDKTRPTTMANAFMLETDDPILTIPDINCYNLYFGWYLGDFEQNDSFFDEYHAKYPDRVIGFSEYGADANPAYQSSHPEQGDYTESYQCVYHEHILDMIERRPYLWATHVWNMFDFAADGRDEGGKHGENQKGLVTFDRKIKKDAFYLYKAYWSSEPFVHICGRRYINRAEDVTEVKVYSNQPEITLFVDGKEFSKQKGGRIFRFNVPITGKHEIKAVCEELSDTIIIQKVSEPDKSYIFGKTGAVVNWFDKEEINQDYYSVIDKMSDLQQNPKAAAIVGEIIAKGRAARGEVAKSTGNNKNLQKIMGGMTFNSLLKKINDLVTPEQIAEINKNLQKIKKQG